MRAANRPSFEEWAHARQQALVRSAYLLTGDFQRAEDLVQETLIRAALRWDTLIDGNADAWARRVIYRQHVSWWRRTRREVLVAHVPEIGQHETSAAASSDLLDALAQLSKGQRAVLLLRFAEDLSIAETADVLGVSDGTVKRQTFVALSRLRKFDPLFSDLVEER